MSTTPAAPGDSAGVPWAGREFTANAFAADDGSTPRHYRRAVEALHAGTGTVDDVIAALRTSRLLMPLIADLSESGTNAHGTAIDKRAELALPTVLGPDGRAVLPAFSSAGAMRLWNPAARPTPAPARQVALGAASDGTELVIIDPGSPHPFGLRRGAIESLARDLPWLPSWQDPDVIRALQDASASEDAVTDQQVAPGDPRSELVGAEVLVTLQIRAGLTRADLEALLRRVQVRWASDPIIAARVDSLAARATTVPAP